ncbi:MAG: glycoside-pentoside-hexuronide (GPH):cation symporter [Verrucomicrobiota bacterium]|nr:glycoside-pentoside-hexuronide (GPH):cation symporter [Verrucomicrobiota bacterium]
MSETRLKPIEKIGYGLGDFGSNVVFQTILILLPAFYTDVFGLAPAAMGTMFLAVRLLDTVTDPIMGVIADNTNTRWGKFRPYLLWFAIPFSVIFVLTFITPDLSESGKLTYAYLTYALLMVLYTVVNIPYCALGGVITSDSQERVSANSYRFFIATSAGVLISFFSPGLVERFGNGNQQAGYPYAMAVFGILAVFAFFGCFYLTKERVRQVSQTKGSFALDFKTLLKNDQWLVVAALFLVLLIPIVLRGASQVYYVKWFMGKPELIAAFLTTGTFCQMVGAGFASSLTRKLGKVPAYILVQSIIVLGSIALYFISNSNIWVIFILFGLINFFVQMGAPILFTMAADTVEYGELKTGRRVTGLVFSGALFALKLGVAVGGWLIGLILAYYGYDGQAESQNPEAVRGIVLSLTLFPAIGHFILIPIVCLYKLNQTRCDEIRKELDGQSIT